MTTEDKDANQGIEGHHLPKRPGGPPKREPQPGERVALSLRMTPDLKRRLDAAAEMGGRSQSQEAEIRLQQSFDRLDLLPDVLVLAYGREYAGILMMLGFAMTDITQRHSRHAPTQGSHGRAYEFERALFAAAAVLFAFRTPSRMQDFLSEADVRILTKFVQAVTSGSGGWEPRLGPPPPWCDVKIINKLLGPRVRRARPSTRRLMIREVRVAEARASKPEAELDVASAADAVLKLINNSPRTPSHEEITAILRQELLSKKG